MKQYLKKAVEQKLKEKVEGQKWQGCLLWTRWEDDQLSKRGRVCAPTYVIAGIMESYEQLLPT